MPDNRKGLMKDIRKGLIDCRKEEDIDPEQIRKDIERLELTKKKRSVSQLWVCQLRCL